MSLTPREMLEDATVRLFLDDDFEGTAFFIHADGWLLTAYHCLAAYVQKTVRKVTIVTRDDMRLDVVYHPDKSLPQHDIAVLKADTLPAACVPLSQYREDWRGQDVVAVGYPAVHDPNDKLAGYYPGKIFHHTANKIESDAGKGRGQSGGPLFHPATGRIIGVICEGYQANQLSDAGLSARLEPLFAHWRELDDLNRQTIDDWERGITPPVARMPSPYKGLAAFQAHDAKRFYGRTQETDKLCQRVAQHRFCALLGASGSGKSSLVFAGVEYRLSQSKQWDIRVFRPKNDPFANLLSAFKPPLQTDNWESLRDRLDRGDLALSQLCDPLLQQGQRVLLIADQFEELFTLNPDPDLQRRFCLCLTENLRSPLPTAQTYSLLLTLRADFLAAAAEYLSDALNQANFILGPLTPDGVREAIEKPLPANFHFESGLIELILHDLGQEPGALPLLQFTLDALWQRQRRYRLSHAAYQELGGVRRALASHADGIYAKLSDAEKIALRRLFIQLVQPGEGTEDTRKVADLRQFADPAQHDLIRRLADEKVRLLVTGENTLEVAHEALIRHWTPLREWLKEDRPFRVWQEGLQRYLKDQVLLSGAALATAQEWLEKRGEEIRADERALIERSVEKIAQELAEKRRQQRRWTVFVLVFFIVALGLSGVAAWFWQASEENARVAEQNEKTAAANAKESAENAKIAAQNEQRATQKAEEAQEKFTQSIINQSRMLSGYAEIALKEAKPGLAMRLALEALPEYSETYPDRPFVAVAYDGLSRGIHRQFQGIFEHETHEPDVNKAVFSPDGTRLLTASGRQALVWDMKTGQLLLTLLGHEDTANSAAYSADGTRIVTASEDKTARVWDAQTGQAIRTLQGHEHVVWSAAYSPDGTQIVTASGDKTACVWDAQTGQAIRALLGHESSVRSAAYSPDGTRIVTASGDDTARVWDAQIGQVILSLLGHENIVYSAAYSADGTRIVTASEDKTARVWDAQTGQAIRTLQGHSESVRSAAYSADGTRIVTASGDDTARVWDAQTEQAIRTLQGHEHVVWSAAYSPDGTRIVTASDDKTARVWETESGEQLAILPHEDNVTSARFSPDGLQIVTASNNETARIWLSFPSLAAMVEHAKKMLLPRISDDKGKGDVGIENFRLTCAERKRFFLEEMARCRAD